MNMTSLTRRLVVASAATGLVLSGATGVASAQSGDSSSETLSSDSLGDTSGGSSDNSSSDNSSSNGESSDTGSSDNGSSASSPAASLAGSAAEMSAEAALGSLEADGATTLILVGAGIAAGIYFAPQIHQSLTDAGIPLPPLP